MSSEITNGKTAASAQGRVRLRRFAALAVPAVVAGGTMVVLTAQGVLAAQFAISGMPFTITAKQLTGEGMPKYSAVYEIDSPDVLTSAAWAEAGELGRWAKEVRPFTKNRRHLVRKVV